MTLKLVLSSPSGAPPLDEGKGPWGAIKVAIENAAGLSEDALHVHVGLAIMLIALVTFRSRGLLFPLILVFVAALTNEAIDISVLSGEPEGFSWQESISDVMNTVFWPTMLFGILGWHHGLKR